MLTLWTHLKDFQVSFLERRRATSIQMCGQTGHPASFKDCKECLKMTKNTARLGRRSGNPNHRGNSNYQINFPKNVCKNDRSCVRRTLLWLRTNIYFKLLCYGFIQWTFKNYQFIPSLWIRISTLYCEWLFLKDVSNTNLQATKIYANETT